MFEQRHQFSGRETIANRVDGEIEKGSGNSLAEGPSGAVVNANAPALQPDSNAPREQPVRRDEGCCAPRDFDGFA